jgi:lipoyl(octanoyl) transferase
MDRPAEAPLERASSSPAPITAWWLGRTSYRDAWDLQHRLVTARVAGDVGDQLLLLEHEPVLTLGRHSDPAHVLATPAELAVRGIELIRTERGGEVTYHGPGQLTAYTIIKLADRGLLIRPLVRALEAALIETCAAFGVSADRRDGYPGCWCGDGGRKIGALGIRIERGVSYHGIALNVTVSLADFALIDACGMPDVESTSIEREGGPEYARAGGRPQEPSTESVERAAAVFAPALAAALGAPLNDAPTPAADPAVAREALERLIVSRTSLAAGAR